MKLDDFHKMLANMPASTQRLNAHHRSPPQIPLPEPVQPAPALAGGDEGKAQGSRLPAVRITHRRVKLLDIDAKYSAIKHLLDGLQHASIIHDDKEGSITLEVRQEKVAHYTEEETVIEVDLPE